MSEQLAQPDVEQPLVHRPEHRAWMGLEPSIVVVSLVVAMGFGFHEHHKLNEANARLSAYAIRKPSNSTFSAPAALSGGRRKQKHQPSRKSARPGRN